MEGTMDGGNSTKRGFQDLLTVYITLANNRLAKQKHVHFDEEENSTKPLKQNELVLTSASKLRVPLAGRMAHWLPNLPLSFALVVGFTSFFLKSYSFGNSDR